MLLILSPLLPLLTIPFVLRRPGVWWMVAAPVPALLAGFILPAGTFVSLPWLLFGTHRLLEHTGRLFMQFGAMIWLLGALYLAFIRSTETASSIFKTCFLLAMSGNLLLILAADMITFYLGYALMGLSAYGLVISHSQRSKYAGRIYLVFTLIGELALFCAILLLYATDESLLLFGGHQPVLPDVAIALLILGFGIKLALPALHFWLPITYASAPIVGVAMLSGPMMKSGLLGWVRFLPMGDPALTFWSEFLVTLGTLGVGIGILMGVLQKDPRTILAYSSVTKMGMISAVIGFTLSQSEQASFIITAITLFAMHHMLVKPMLFMGVDLWNRGYARNWVIAGVILLALSLAGAPLLGGAMAKSQVSETLTFEMQWLLVLSALGTTILMTRLVWLLMQRKKEAIKGHAKALTLWLLFLPVAVWGPFTPNTIEIDIFSITPLLIGSVFFVLGVLLPLPWKGRVVNLRSLDRIPIALISRAGSSINRSMHQKYSESSYELNWSWSHLLYREKDRLDLSMAGLLWFLSIVLFLVVLILPFFSTEGMK